MKVPEGEFTTLFERYRGGDDAAAEQLVPIVHDELHRLARRALAKLPQGRTLQTTALLNEAWLRVGVHSEPDVNGREHFLALAARTMRAIVVDHARRRGAQRREHEPLELDRVVDAFEHGSRDLVALDVALEELTEVRPELARVVELRFFAGMKHPAIARVLGVPLRRVERHWSTARAWLFARLAEEGAGGAS